MVRWPSVLCVIAAAALADSAAAQRWNDTRTMALVERATERRATQLADTGLVDYRARAHGYLTFLAQLGAGFPEPPKIIKADELALDVFWRAPNLSKQLIVGRRDTLLLPTDIQYHRDHLGIVQNNFPSIIRLGEGDEVQDVPHPLSATGLREYDFAIGDSLELRLGPRTIEVYEVRVRPRDDRTPRIVGAVYVDRESADLVRMAFGFTRAALRDRTLEDLTILLENGLIEGRWLPRRQEIEIRRTGTWLDYPVRTIIRGRWEICCYAVNAGIDPAFFQGPEIVLGRPRPRLPGDTTPPLFVGAILDSIPEDIRAVTEADVARIQEEARRLVRAQALARTSAPAIAGRRVSDFIRFNRVEGFAIGAGIGQRVANGVAVVGQGRYGFDDHRWKARGELSFTRPNGARISAAWTDSHVDAGDVAEVSLVRNTIAAQEFGSDYTEPVSVRGPSVSVALPVRLLNLALDLAEERQAPVAVNATPAHGRFEPTVPALRAAVRRAAVSLEQPTRLLRGGAEVRFALHAALLRVAATESDVVSRYGRAGLAVRAQRSFGEGRGVFDMFAGGVGGGPAAAPQHHIFLGGPVSGPGYDYHEFVGRRGGYARLEWRSPTPFVSVPLGRFGRTPPTVTLAPFIHAVWTAAPPPFAAAAAARRGIHPAVGIGLMPFFELLRIDIARGLRNGRWTFSVDISRDFWPVL